MQFIDRSAVPIPDCLVKPPERYNDLNGLNKEEIRTTLLKIQGGRCAYCERRTGDGRKDGHIEHFRNQAVHVNLECEWTNMFWSCNDENTCGKYKDKCVNQSGPQKVFDRDHIIDPGVENPEDLLLFAYDGMVHLVDELNELNQQRAEETLRIFQLRSPLLRKSREDAVNPYKSIIELLLKNNPELISPYIQSELGKLATTPFYTPIKTFLKSVA
jgi:uncharacterized protein (TIGR02646 family)